MARPTATDEEDYMQAMSARQRAEQELIIIELRAAIEAAYNEGYDKGVLLKHPDFRHTSWFNSAARAKLKPKE